MQEESGQELPNVPDARIPGDPWRRLSTNEHVYSTIRECLLESHNFAVHPHCKREMAEDNIDREEVVAVLLHGKMVTHSRGKENPRWNDKSVPREWSYRIECRVEERLLTVIARFRDCNGEPFLVAYTCWSHHDD